MTGQILQFGGSLLAILVLAWLVHRLGMGRPQLLDSEEEALRAADEVDNGFIAKTVTLDQHGEGALLRDTQGRIMLLRAHGAHFAGRLLGPAAMAEVEGDALHVYSGERQFGSVTLAISEPDIWAREICAL